MNAGVPAAVQVAALVAAAVVLAAAARRLPWHKLEADREAQRVLVLATLGLAALRWFNADALAGSSLHFIGAAIASLMFGPAFALWALAVASLLAWIGDTAWLGWAPDFLACGVVPVVAARAVFRFEQSRLPANLFIYVLVNGFVGGAVSMLASQLVKAGASAWLGIGDPGFYLISAVPMMFGEGFLSGGAMALVVVYRPQWCATFDDQRYLCPPGDPPPA
jgi:uncharacterized membrane protein